MSYKKINYFIFNQPDFEFQDQNDIGCFVQEDIPLYYRKFELINTNAPGKCSTICQNDGYTFAGIMG